MTYFNHVDDPQRERVDYQKLYERLAEAVRQMNAAYAACAAEEEAAIKLEQKKLLDRYGLTELPEKD